MPIYRRALCRGHCRVKVARDDDATAGPVARSRNMKPFALLAILAPATLLAGCTTPAYVSPVEVTRFLGDRPAALGSGTISVRSVPGVPSDGWDYSAFQGAVVRNLAELGYTVVPADGAQVAEIAVSRQVAQAQPRRSPVDVGVGGSTGSYGSGVGVGVGINLGSLGGRPAEQVDTALSVSIKPAAGGTALWEGRARFSATANSAYAERQASANKLADALFSGFPGRSGETIEVR